jgi:hypothetical protein
MNTAGTELEGKKITYTLGDWDNNQHPSFVELMKVGALNKKMVKFSSLYIDLSRILMYIMNNVI